MLDARVQGDTFHVVVPLITETIAGFSMVPRAAQLDRVADSPARPWATLTR